MVDISQSPHGLGFAPAVRRIPVGRVVTETFATVGRAWATYYAVSLALAALGLPAVLNLLTPGHGALRAVAVACSIIKPLLALFLQTALIHGTMRLISGDALVLGDAFKVGGRRLLPYLGATIILVLGIVLGLVLLVVPGIILSCVYGLSPIITVIEGKGPIASQSRSRELTRNNRWRVLGVSVLFYLVPFLLFAGVGVVAGATHTAAALPRSPAFQGGTLLFNFIAMPLYIVFPVLLYHHLRQVAGESGPRGISDVFD